MRGLAPFPQAKKVHQMTTAPLSAHADQSPTLPVSVQVLSTILFAAFAIPVTIVALNVFWPAGIAIAALLAWRGGFAPSMGRTTSAAEMAATLKTLVPETAGMRPSGNASFDAYRVDMLTRLEQEQQNFDGFLERLRDAKDKAEFDQFMDDRAGAQITHAD